MFSVSFPLCVQHVDFQGNGCVNTQTYALISLPSSAPEFTLLPSVHKRSTFVVLDLVGVPVLFALLPLLKLRDRVEADLLLVLGRLHDGRDELLQEGLAEQRRPVVVQEVDEQTLDVGAVLWTGPAHQPRMAPCQRARGLHRGRAAQSTASRRQGHVDSVIANVPLGP